jgi:predicted TPR repeat methyltransferase
MLALRLSSGDLVADRRASYAQMLFEAGDHGPAADLMRDAVMLAPGWAAGWFRLGEMLAEAARPAEAAEAWREALRLDPADRLGATLKLAAAGHVAGINAPPAAFVEALFDQYAADFDAALVERLAYRVPELLAAALERAAPAGFTHAVDLGCGTGLMAERIAGRASFIEGVDISAEMLRRAGTKGLYGKLTHADLTGFDMPRGADLVTAADVFMYVGALDTLFARIAASLPPGGVFAFSTEAHEGPEAFVLRESRRYAHSQPYLRRLLAAGGLDVVSFEEATIRMDRGEPLKGYVVVALRAAASAVRLTAASETAVLPLH